MSQTANVENPRIRFADGCTFTRNQNGSVTVAWVNGNALQAVKGAAVDYVAPHFYMACSMVQGAPVYQANPDLARLIAGGVPVRLALVIVGMRKIALSLPGVTISMAEVFIVADQASNGSVPAEDFQHLVANRIAFLGVIDLALTILGLNGISLLNKGHHYKEEDGAWSRLTTAVNLDTMMETLGIQNYEGMLFHDAMHPIDIAFKARLVATMPSPLTGHINGVLQKRLPGVPAGTAVLFVSLAAIDQLMIAKLSTTETLTPLRERMAVLCREVRANPLNWCSVFQVAVTTENLAQIGALEPACAFVYGACKQAFGRSTTILKSMAFKNVGIRHPAMVNLGKSYVEGLDDAPVSDEVIRAMFEKILADMPQVGNA